jgi:predicted enzyme related to lactoylglutathione lyase
LFWRVTFCASVCQTRRLHVVLAVSDVDCAYDFYRQAFGWEHHLAWEGEYVELVVSDTDRLGLYVRDGYSETAGAEPVQLNGPGLA